MKFKVKVLMLLVGMLFGVLGVSAEIADGTYYLKNISSGLYVGSDDWFTLGDKSSAGEFVVTCEMPGCYSIKCGEEYLSTDGTFIEKSGNYFDFEIKGNAESCTIYDFYSETYFINDMGFLGCGGNAENWAFESIGGGETPTYKDLSETILYRLSGQGMYLEAGQNLSMSYADGSLDNSNLSISGSKSQFDMWTIRKVEGENYVYFRHARSNAYLGKAVSSSLNLVADIAEAGKYYVYDNGSIQDSESKNYIAVTGDKLTGLQLNITTEATAWSFAVADFEYTLTLNDYGYATTCMPFNFTVSEGAEIYGTTDVHDYSDYTTLKVHQVEGVAQAGQGYIIKGEPRAEGEPQKTVTLTPTTSEADDEAESSMLGTLIRQTGVYAALGYKYYGFKGDEFVLASSDAIPANKAVYIPELASSVMKMSLGFDEGLTTDILGLTPDASASQPLYDLQGRSCMGQSHKGLYIQNGHKMIRR